MKIIFRLLSIIFMVIGIVFTIIYTNLFSFGYTFAEYLLFIFSRFEVDIFFLGFVLQFLCYKKDRF